MSPSLNKMLLIIESPKLKRPEQQKLQPDGYSLNRSQTAAAAFEMAGSQTPAVILVSPHIPDMSLTDFVTTFSRQYPETIILVMAGTQECQQAADAIRCGAADYLLRPFTEHQLLNAIKQAESLRQPLPNLVVNSAKSRQVMQLAHRAAQTDASVLISGESGTGKERLAQYIHDSSPRSSGPFVAINCAAIPNDMIEAVLFGHAKGAFTGAVTSQMGKFELADGGTLMLDEISDMPLALQTKLLRVLQERELERLGSNKTVRLNIRIIAATNKNLAELVAQGLFRQDLYYRLDVLPLNCPALRDRQDDILPLAQHFLKKYAHSGEYSICSAAKQALKNHAWPGNVRELENVIQRALIMARGMVLQVVDLMLPQTSSQADRDPLTAASPLTGLGLKSSKKRAEYQCVLDTLKKFNGHKTKTAEALGFSPRALRYKMAAMREQGIQV